MNNLRNNPTTLNDVSRRLLPLWWVIALVSALAISSYFSGESTHFLGIADDQEQTIRFETPVEVIRTHVVAGQAVAAGTLLLEASRGELASQKAIVLEKLAELRARDRQERASMEAEIARLKAESEAQRAALNNKIKELQYRQRFNREYIDRLANVDGGGPPLDGGPPPTTADSQAQRDPIGDQIAGLSAQRRALERAMQASTNDLESQINATQRPYDSQIAELIKQQQELQRQETQLTVYAKFDGRIGSVMFKTGATIPPYQPILTVHGTKPTFIQGYIHENVFNRVQIGEVVHIEPVNRGYEDSVHTGTVESLGTRIVEYPARLNHNPMVAAWGREVVVKISNDHSLLLGEKVSITVPQSATPIARWVENGTKTLRRWLRLEDAAHHSTEISTAEPVIHGGLKVSRAQPTPPKPGNRAAL